MQAGGKNRSTLMYLQLISLSMSTGITIILLVASGNTIAVIAGVISALVNCLTPIRHLSDTYPPGRWAHFLD